MHNRKRKTVKKTVSFSDDQNLTNANLNNHRKGHIDDDTPPVYVRKSWTLIPFHLLALLYWFLKYTDFNLLALLYIMIPTQVIYLIFRFNKNTIYGKKRLRLNWLLVFITLGACLLLSIPCLAIIVLFGAPFVELLKESWLLALHCCFLTYPAVYDVFNCNFKVGYFKKYFISVVIGCWISCFVIPLDWDRDWQAWPVPLIVGAYLGSFIGFSIGGYI
ncbi:mannose-ethanolamine phosphotransferase GPI11 [Kluyveromyces lactis]|uniref:Glycosylphosphatidylinositol anchor biosynthesis protein 11 n=1 Tax=Kluyveromyces lactis (strain ATCC 8585 / CBS 2359 / DSM 70799 / NBRC 1267 / NRRL Y-1140 / WM37) TaxID=284590 RepID=GPI11_KLULA|nr:uncharacterized protein KLLA0_C10252g [Kluyveromyces lactis]Q6CTT3.1 RecName: Full=Glycosylphosphatidylinositol anchor biosynthesis protein 11 [Kluyveromyces lactis NRRL Y-1140]CAH01507.1 KLLA0C10252p [Kluyveromyces lactis]|eukprot:XP_452656.1 uncharacterized protein KLLA0_C10252g [Kluyveromyces lactis]